jgi:hypothetical protein
VFLWYGCLFSGSGQTLSAASADMKTDIRNSLIISVGFWRWCVGIERIVFLDFIHRLVSQKIEE